jgi:hypothetical protein
MAGRQHASDRESGEADRPVAVPRRPMWRRRATLIALVGAAISWLGACQGPAATTTIDVRARCIGVALGNPGPDLGEFTIRIEMGAPEWADQGETVSLSDMRVTSYDLFDELLEANLINPFVGLSMSGEGLSGPFGPGGFVAFYDRDGTTDLGSRNATVDGSAGSLGTVRVQEIVLGEAHAHLRCTPVAGSPTRLAAIEIR